MMEHIKSFSRIDDRFSGINSKGKIFDEEEENTRDTKLIIYGSRKVEKKVYKKIREENFDKACNLVANFGT